MRRNMCGSTLYGYEDDTSGEGIFQKGKHETDRRTSSVESGLRYGRGSGGRRTRNGREWDSIFRRRRILESFVREHTVH